MVKGRGASSVRRGGGRSSFTRVISITSGKGGVGKTNMVANLAVAFADMGKRVLIFDADMGLANVDIIFGIHPQYHVGHVITGEKELSEVIAKASGRVGVIPAASGDTAFAELTEGQKLSLLAEFEGLDNLYDIMLIDTAAGISSNVIYFNSAAEECIVVVTGEPTSVTDAYGMIKVMFLNGTKHFKLLVNMARGLQEAKAVYATLSQAADRFLKGVVLEFVGYVPFDDHLRQAVVGRKPVIELCPAAPSSRSIVKIAEQILKSPSGTSGSGNISFFMNRLISGDNP
ncbi:MinD/ParA family protein [Desulfoluna sp.]|uniref:MinD/ParA family protein n=1 Tax=Desulfoluna sp. TaxID=2045199 RepID=UPI00262A4FFC|nr:MinD/ParA family protein [Desulfoluna sp.]